MFTEAELIAIYKRHPFLTGYVSTMLEDLQGTESDQACSEDRDERDAGTIYTIPAETFGRALADCEAFMRVADRDGALSDAESFMTWEALGGDFHLTRVGHGTGFWDRPELKREDDEGSYSGTIGDVLTAAAELFRNEGGYFGDDGRVYL